MRNGFKLTLTWMILSLLFAACSSGGGEASPTPEPEVVLTAAAETAAFQMTELAQPSATNTSSPSQDDVIPPATEGIPSITESAPADSTPEPTPITGGIDQAEFWADVTIPDGTNFNPGDTFTKVWKLRNSGTNTWTKDYNFGYFGGDQMSAPNTVPISANVAPGDTTDISVDMVAPNASGNYLGYWKMINAAGEFFEYAVYVQINVVAGSQAATTSPPQPSGSGEVTKVSIAVDDASPADCPHTFTFTASFTLDEAATVTYQLEAGSDTPGFTYNLPGELTGTFEAGTHSVTYYLQIDDAVDGWAQFHVLSPSDKISSPVSFSLSCGS